MLSLHAKNKQWRFSTFIFIECQGNNVGAKEMNVGKIYIYFKPEDLSLTPTKFC